ncbi:GNAT family N-acetyltransferase [Kribbella sp. NPDC003505]|uniref:GNAT family N-acetyltransferase n=1 Tax=Kribbella sp. NPDC003505 TaxID=3154448 RepID=UPI0033B8DF95
MIRIEDRVDGFSLGDLMSLFSSAWWTANRTVEETEQILQESDIVVALVESSTDRIIGFGRVLTDYVHVALVLDVVVAPEYRGSGCGAALMDAIVEHPELADVRSIELICQPDLIAFYSRWGFTNQAGGSLLMRRTAPIRVER